jgi:putative phosphoserine phosphatase/1-acylglycerol-3-phosphate O-acyltransferase
MIAPEGTRLDTTSVGPFKKGPFRIAMAAGIPIVPIVIRNAEIIAARNSTTMNPGTVDVAVFPPIPVSDWTIDTLPDRIAEVRQLYLDTLADWPVDQLPDAGVYGREKKPAPRKSSRKATKAAPVKAAARKTAKAAAQPKTPASKVTKAQKSTPRPKGRS